MTGIFYIIKFNKSTLKNKGWYQFEFGFILRIVWSAFDSVNAKINYLRPFYFIITVNLLTPFSFGDSYVYKYIPLAIGSPDSVLPSHVIS